MRLGGDGNIISDPGSLGDGMAARSHTPGPKPLSGTHQAFNNRSACLCPLAKLDFSFNNRVRFNSVVNGHLLLCYLKGSLVFRRIAGSLVQTTLLPSHIAETVNSL